MATINQVTVNGTTYDLAVNAANVSGTASQSAAGLMSAADKTKLDGVATGANKSPTFSLSGTTLTITP